MKVRPPNDPNRPVQKFCAKDIERSGTLAPSVFHETLQDEALGAASCP